MCRSVKLGIGFRVKRTEEKNGRETKKNEAVPGIGPVPMVCCSGGTVWTSNERVLFTFPITSEELGRENCQNHQDA